MDTVSLASRTTLKIGGKAQHFFPIKEKEIFAKRFLSPAKKHLPIFVLGGGS